VGGQQVYSVCGRCTVRCPIQVKVLNDRITSIQGNPHAAGIQGGLCARGGAGGALIDDEEQPQYPLIRTGKRGEGQWRRISRAGEIAHLHNCTISSSQLVPNLEKEDQRC
jgi:thiosulfate reductase / polysulfide reductase chain A